MTSLSLFLTAHRKQGRAAQTHTRFDGRHVGTLSISKDEVAPLQQLLFNYVGIKSDSELSKIEGVNAISEKVVAGEPFRFFVDLDFKLSQVQHLSHQVLVEAMKQFIMLCNDTVVDAFGPTRCVPTRRLVYKLHLHFPDLIVSKDTAMRISSAMREKLRGLTLYTDDVLDQSVYTSGLRMLYCHKGALGKKCHKGDNNLRQAIVEHETIFGVGTYEHVYEVIDLDTFKKLHPRSLTHIQDTSLLTTADQTLTELPVALITAAPATLGKRRVKTKGGAAVPIETGSVSEEAVVPAPVKSFVEDAFSVVLNHKMKVFTDSKSLALSTSNQQVCPFKQRRHRGNNVYIYIDVQGMTKRCHDGDCRGKTYGAIPFANFPPEVTLALSELVTKIYHTEEKMEAVSREMQRLRKDYPRNTFHIDPTNARIDSQSAQLRLTDLYCLKCKKEHTDPQTYLQCNLDGKVSLKCLQDFWGPEHPLTHIPPSVTSVLFQGLVQINISNTVNHYEGSGGLVHEPRDFGAYSDFPAIYQNQELNQRCHGSLTGRTYDVAEYMALLMQDQYIYQDKQWFKFTGKYWRESVGPDDLMTRDITRVYCQLQEHYRTEKQVKWLHNLIEEMGNLQRRKTYIEDLERYVAENSARMPLDDEPALISFENGTFDSETCTFREHRASDYLTHMLPYDLPQQVDSVIREELESVIRDIIPDDEVRDFLILLLSLHLEGINRHNIAMIWTGIGGNGKSFLAELLQSAFCSLYKQPSPTLLTSERPSSDRPMADLCSFKTSRVLLTSEPQAGKKINSGFLKFLTGCDRVTTRNLNSSVYMEYIPRFLVTLLCNVVPLFEGGDEEVRGLWRRIKIIHFSTVFKTNPDPNNPNEKPVDTAMAARAKSWGPHFMRLLIDRYQHYVQNGRSMVVPEKVENNLEEQKDENSPLDSWLDTHLISAPGRRLHLHRIEKTYIKMTRNAVRTGTIINKLTTRKIVVSQPGNPGKQRDEVCCVNGSRFANNVDIKEYARLKEEYRL